VAEGARLLAIAQDEERRSPAGIRDVGRNQPAVPGHSLSIRVKDPRNDGIDAPLDVVRHGQALGEALSLVVGAPGSDGIQGSQGGLSLRALQWIPVDGIGGGEQKAAPVLAGHIEHRRRSERRGSSDLHRMRAEEPGIGGRRQVQDSVERRRDVERLRHVVVEQLEAVGSQQVLHAVCGGGEEIVYSQNPVPTPDEEIAEVRPDEARAAGDEKT
jgi:hypothetical protein